MYNTLALTVVLYGSVTWISIETKEQRLRMSEMKFLKRIKGYTRGNRTRNVIMWIELNIEPLEEKAQRNTTNLSIVDEDHIPKTLVNISLRDAIVWDSNWNAYEAELTCPKLVNGHHDTIKVIRNLHTCILLLITIISLP